MLMLLTLTACGEGGGERTLNVSTNPAIEALAGKLFDAIQKGNDEEIIQQYNEVFFAKRSPQQWLDNIKALIAERGPMRAYHLRRSQADTRFSGKFYMLEYETVHTGNKRLHHVLTFVLPVTGGDIQLNGHKITPWETDVTENDNVNPEQ
ncbi:MAG: hypothetical protein GXP18_00630 [Gammaproteobacteria bacterium]|nr:hypothetical protein [Gammaproteobacteria bacterium]